MSGWKVWATDIWWKNGIPQIGGIFPKLALLILVRTDLVGIG